MSDKFGEPEWSKQAAKEFAEEFCNYVDCVFVEGLKDLHKQINVANFLQRCIDDVSKGYGFKVDE